MPTSKIVLFDIPSRKPLHCWSANVWKTRMLLNIKGLDYETEWVEYPEIKPRLQYHFPDRKDFTVPTIKMPDDTYIMDSWTIAQEIERLHPSPPLNLDSPILPRYLSLHGKAFMEIMPNYILEAPRRLLNDINHAYWHHTRSQWVGKPLDQFVQERGGEKAFRAGAPYLQQITALLKENGGPFFMGQTISYTDFVHTGFLVMFRLLGDDLFKPLLDATGDPETHLRFLEAVKPYIDRDNY
ncbi:putative glutathione S-transferase [Xylaria sp. CBS 124048]|nr:putative glutathione S-transferase [Xylaria sp. CBS 124048]